MDLERLCVLIFSEDIPLLSEDYPGKQGTWNFQVQCTYTNTIWEFNQPGQNQPPAVYTPQMDIIVVYHGAMTVAGQSVTLNTGLVPPGVPIPQLAKVSFSLRQTCIQEENLISALS
jgi:hypothetical protein